MKIKEFLAQIESSEFTEFDDQYAFVRTDTDGEVHVYIGDGSAQSNYIYADAERLLRFAKMFKRLAEHVASRG